MLVIDLTRNEKKLNRTTIYLSNKICKYNMNENDKQTNNSKYLSIVSNYKNGKQANIHCYIELYCKNKTIFFDDNKENRNGFNEMDLSQKFILIANECLTTDEMNRYICK